MTITTYKWSLDRYHQAVCAEVFDNQPVELLRGEIITMPPEGEPHAYYNRETGDYLRELLSTRAKVSEAHPITLSDDSEPILDLAIVKPLGATYLEHHPYPEDIYWLIEFSNATLTKDLTTKKDTYAASGIQEYWVVNLQEQQLHIFRALKNAQYTSEEILNSGTVSPIAFKDVRIQVSRLMTP